MRLALGDALAGRDQEGDHLARHRRGQAPGLGAAVAGMRQQVDLNQLGSALRREQFDPFAIKVDRGQAALRAKADVERPVATLARRELQCARDGCRALAHGQLQLNVALIGQGRGHALAEVVEGEAACADAVAAPAVGLAERISAFGGALGQQGLRDRGSDRQRQADLVLAEQHGALALDQRGVEIGASE